MTPQIARSRPIKSLGKPMKLWTKIIAAAFSPILALPFCAEAFQFLGDPGEEPKARTCHENSLRCWFVVFGAKEAPERIVYLVDANATEISANVKRTRIAEARESLAPDQPEYLLYTTDFDCKKNKMRQVESYRAWRDNRMEHDAKTYDWVPVPMAWTKRAWSLVCDPAVVREPAAHQVIHLADVYRGADAIGLVRMILWGNEKGPGFRDEVE